MVIPRLPFLCLVVISFVGSGDICPSSCRGDGAGELESDRRQRVDFHHGTGVSVGPPGFLSNRCEASVTLEDGSGRIRCLGRSAHRPHHCKQISNSTARRSLGYLSTCVTGNPIDDCWRCDPEWHLHRKRLADCGIGFGRSAMGGRNGRFYRVTDPSDDDPVNPRPGTLRHAVIKDEPLWIVFKRDMVITLKQELIMNSFKTIDGRGANVHIANGACITIQFVTNIIIHGLHVHDCKPTGNAMVRSSPSHYGWRTIADGDAISIFGSSHIWVDHNSLSNCADGLVDAIMGSTAITISNNYFTHHNEVSSASLNTLIYCFFRMPTSTHYSLNCAL
ncbi:hypothetical protein B296_00020573 [Ensete ventricosum]|uniref:Pectate lyase n=1 Tax=Ensete ventricosum TaxID=4639 RepID=A0A426Y1G5_ENSVE|nr:hypothetical protein B296_00020573 [Ensete ventricosum]